MLINSDVLIEPIDASDENSIFSLLSRENLTEDDITAFFQEHYSHLGVAGSDISDKFFHLTFDEQLGDFRTNALQIMSTLLTQANKIYADMLIELGNISPDDAMAINKVLDLRNRFHQIDDGITDAMGTGYYIDEEFASKDIITGYYDIDADLITGIQSKLIACLHSVDYLIAFEKSESYGSKKHHIFDKVFNNKDISYDETENILKNDIPYQTYTEKERYYSAYCHLKLVEKSCEERIADYLSVLKNPENDAEILPGVKKSMVAIALDEIMVEGLSFYESRDLLFRIRRERKTEGASAARFIEAVYIAFIERYMVEMCGYIRKAYCYSASSFQKSTKLLRYHRTASLILHEFSEICMAFGKFNGIWSEYAMWGSPLDILRQAADIVYFHKIIEFFPVKADYVYYHLADAHKLRDDFFAEWQEFMDEIGQFLTKEAETECFWES